MSMISHSCAHSTSSRSSSEIDTTHQQKRPTSLALPISLQMTSAQNTQSSLEPNNNIDNAYVFSFTTSDENNSHQHHSGLLEKYSECCHNVALQFKPEQIKNKVDIYTGSKEDPAIYLRIERSRYFDIATNSHTMIFTSTGEETTANHVFYNGKPVAIRVQYPTEQMLGSHFDILFNQKIDQNVVISTPEDAIFKLKIGDFRYFEQEGTYQCGNVEYTVIPEKANEFTDELGNVFSVRKMKIIKNENNRKESKLITNIHIKNWEDRTGISSEKLDGIIKIMEKNGYQDKKGNAMIHCSAGVGRTGVLLSSLIAKSNLSELILKNNLLEDRQKVSDLIINELRLQCNQYMVQTEEQEKCVKDYLEHLLSNNSALDPEEGEKIYYDMLEISQCKSSTGNKKNGQ